MISRMSGYQEIHTHSQTVEQKYSPIQPAWLNFVSQSYGNLQEALEIFLTTNAK